MIHFGKIFFIIMMTFVFIACTNKGYVKEESVFVVFKTPALKYADLGFIYENNEEMEIEIYSSGQPLMTLEISKTNVCMSLLECMDKKSFNTQVLSKWYPDELIEEIFRGKPIFKGEGLSRKRNGFTQKIKDSYKYNIRYNVFYKETIFRDTINNILIKVKRIRS